ncbi:DNA-binding transcriptional LysR family regulator [Azorhizobium sp. AG788]|uniref:LysR family transcriptional regulator n=1 Tax=Azorhizobium sp. AG788 TaxID=2183897 RepID=UPI00105DFFF8|nr:LysR family transcriptional regulator [Azorhizobium sp. AG788]TDT92610.1 DNA-binding transcriptional LysR family regulator [Azorhizobium sp. AG788]
MRINYDLPELRAFLTVARLRNFGRAAAALNLSPSAVSRRISELEQALNVQLLERTTRSVVLTAAGRALVAEVAPLLEKMDQGLNAIVDEARGKGGWLDVGCVTTVAFSIAPGVADRFRRAYPDMHLRFHDDTGKRVTESVMAGGVAFAVNTLLQPPSELLAEHLLDDPYVLVLPRDHPSAGLDAFPWADLSDLPRGGVPLVALKQSSANRKEMDAALEQAGLDAPWSDEVEHLSTMLGFLRAGGVAAVMPRLALLACADWGLSHVRLCDPAIHRRIGLIRRKDLVLSEPARRLWDLFAEELRTHAAP